MKAAHALERIALAFFTIGLFIYVVIEAKLWASDLQLWFLRVGDLQSFLVLSIGIFLFAKLFEKFLKWEINLLLPHRRHRK